ncbi:MAG: AFG1 family ATPase [Amylibacter sp.]|jgi:cell division protein ZapE|nr:AFG1 family ATPase [Amylibacter sp.]
MTSLTKIYEDRVKRGDLQRDSAQEAVLGLFDTVAKTLQKPVKKGLRGLFGKSVEPAKGLYLFGGVGRGKSMLMDLFYDHSEEPHKRRVHFHAFMQEIHALMHEARQKGVEDAIEPVAAEVIKSARLLCFDEMQITDITDAMIVGRLFEKLFEAGVVIVTTSNRHPDDLYKDGLNRNLFLPFISMIKNRMEVYNLDSETDHRQNRLQGHKTYFTPIDEAAEMAIQRVWTDVAGAVREPLVLHHKSREIVLPAFHNGVAMATFRELCGQPLGPGDYLAIAKAIRVLILKDIPRLSREGQNEAKRFVTLIDALYEAKVKLIASAAAEPESLYETGSGAFEFERTASRLREMMSADWGAE